MSNAPSPSEPQRLAVENLVECARELAVARQETDASGSEATYERFCQELSRWERATAPKKLLPLFAALLDELDRAGEALAKAEAMLDMYEQNVDARVEQCDSVTMDADGIEQRCKLRADEHPPFSFHYSASGLKWPLTWGDFYRRRDALAARNTNQGTPE